MSSGHDLTCRHRRFVHVEGDEREDDGGSQQEEDRAENMRARAVNTWQFVVYENGRGSVPKRQRWKGDEVLTLDRCSVQRLQAENTCRC